MRITDNFTTHLRVALRTAALGRVAVGPAARAAAVQRRLVQRPRGAGRVSAVSAVGRAVTFPQVRRRRVHRPGRPAVTTVPRGERFVTVAQNVAVVPEAVA